MKMKKSRARSPIWLTLLIIGLFLGMTACEMPPANIKYIGARSSSYGIKPFPKPNEWKEALNDLGADFPKAQPTLIWIVGVVNPETNGVDLEFPFPGGIYDKINFAGVKQSCPIFDFIIMPESR